MRAIDYSNTVLIWKQRRDNWEIIWRRKLGFHHNNANIRRKAKSVGIISPLSGTPAEAERAYNWFQHRFDELKKAAPEHRQTYLWQQLEDAHKKDDK